MYYDYQQDIELDDEVKGLIRFKRNSWNYDSYKILSASEELRLGFVRVMGVVFLADSVKHKVSVGVDSEGIGKLLRIDY